MVRHIELNRVTSPDPERLQRVRVAIGPESQAEIEESVRQAVAQWGREEMPPETWETPALPISDKPFALPAGQAAARADGTAD